MKHAKSETQIQPKSQYEKKRKKKEQNRYYSAPQSHPFCNETWPYKRGDLSLFWGGGRGNLVVFYNLSTSKIWPLVGGSYKRETTAYTL